MRPAQGAPVSKTPHALFALIRKEHRKMIALLAQIISLSDRAQAVAALAEFTALLRDHERVESEALYPTHALDALPKDIAVAHAGIRSALRHLEDTQSDAAEWWEAVVRLRHNVERHIAEEETALGTTSGIAPPPAYDPVDWPL